jgi:hypothetical protein
MENTMAKVICTLPNASELISGVKFVAHELGVISEEIADDVAAGFAAIKGYFVEGDEPGGDAGASDDLDALKARATELGIEVKSAWKAPRLKAEIKRAEEAAGKVE